MAGSRLVAIVALAAAGIWLKKRMDTQAPTQGEQSFVEDSIEVDVPVSTAYNQWTQFEEFPSFMSGVREVVQVDDSTLHWVWPFAPQPTTRPYSADSRLTSTTASASGRSPLRSKATT